MGEEANEGEEIEVEEKGKEVVEVDSKVEVVIAASKVLNTLQTNKADKGDHSTTPRTTLTSRMAKEDLNIILRII